MEECIRVYNVLKKKTDPWEPIGIQFTENHRNTIIIFTGTVCARCDAHSTI